MSEFSSEVATTTMVADKPEADAVSEEALGSVESEEAEVVTRTPVADATAASSRPLLKPPRSGYMLFAKEKRAEFAESGVAHKKASETAKEIGALWSALNAEEKQGYGKRVGEMQREFQAAIGLLPPLEAAAFSHGIGSVSQGQMQFPLGRIKKLVALDSDINRVSKDATVCIARAVEEFVRSLGRDMALSARRSKRKTLQEKDLSASLYLARKYQFLHHVFTPHLKKQKLSRKRRKVEATAKVETGAGAITSYFGKPVADRSSVLDTTSVLMNDTSIFHSDNDADVTTVSAAAKQPLDTTNDLLLFAVGTSPLADSGTHQSLFQKPADDSTPF